MDFQTSKAWPYLEARKIAQRNITDRKVVFETGYGPSGLPHIGTFAEVARTTMVRRAYEDIMGYPRNVQTRLIVFSDDMDALRKAPDNVPNQQMLEANIGISLTRVPDPFGTHESFAHHNNAMLRDFLDRFGFEYEFMSATEEYEKGTFNDALTTMWDNYDAVQDIILPTLGEARRATYSPFMPRLGDGRIISDGVEKDIVQDFVQFGRHLEGGRRGAATSIHNGHVKCQWKADWALRWLALGVDYEMAGKDLIDSVALSSRIVRALGARPPVNMIYEMFLDEEGHKISKSKGNGLTFEEWLRYGTPDSLSAYLYRDPQKAKKLYPAMVPAAMEEYYAADARYFTQTPDQQLSNPLYHVHSGQVPEIELPVTYQLLLNLAQTAAVKDAVALSRYVCKAFPIRDGTMEDELDILIRHAYAYYRDHLSGKLERRAPTASEAAAMLELANAIEALNNPSDEQIQFEVYEIGKAHYGKEQLRDWFKALYQTLLGQDSGPRFGAFTILYGIEETINLLREIGEKQ